MKSSLPIRILGAGPSGLAAAISLAKAGYDVEVFERNKDCGQRFRGDLQGLENWSEKADVIEDLNSMGIEVNFYCKPFSTAILTDGALTTKINSRKPFFFLVKRGQVEGSLDQGLKQQAISSGVKIKFNSTILQNDAGIVATGLIMKEIFAIDKGIVFETNADDLAVGLINQEAAYKGYSYLLVSEGYGCMCTVLFDKFERVNTCFEETKKIFSKLFSLEIKNPKSVGGVGGFSLKNQFKANGQLFVGEAAGIQDLFAGFGIRSAIKSGHLAAQAIIENSDYEKAAKSCFTSKLKASIVNRFLYEKIPSKIMLKFALSKASSIKVPRMVAYKLYNFGLLHRLLFPFARFYIKRRYKNLRL